MEGGRRAKRQAKNKEHRSKEKLTEKQNRECHDVNFLEGVQSKSSPQRKNHEAFGNCQRWSEVILTCFLLFAHLVATLATATTTVDLISHTVNETSKRKGQPTVLTAGFSNSLLPSLCKCGSRALLHKAFPASYPILALCVEASVTNNS